MHFLITAGPTREPIDPVRFLSNRSSGKMGYAVAAAAQSRGHRVTLVSGPVFRKVPPGVDRVRVETADEMLAALETVLEDVDVLVMAAAVADFRPRDVSPTKKKKRSLDASAMVLRLEPTPDILSRLSPRKGHRFFVGFAAETGDPLPEAQRKCREKNLDMVVANDVSLPDAGFEVETNRVQIVTQDGNVETWPLLEKREIGQRLVRWIEAAYLPPPLKIQSMA